jgi:hypothetical protein
MRGSPKAVGHTITCDTVLAEVLDLVDVTPLSSQLNSKDDWEAVREYLKVCSTIVQRYQELLATEDVGW